MKKVLFVISVMLSAASPVQAQLEKCETEAVYIKGVDRFVAHDHFNVNSGHLSITSSSVKISNLGNGGMPNDNFERYVLNTNALVPDRELCGFFVRELSVDLKFTSTSCSRC